MICSQVCNIAQNHKAITQKVRPSFQIHSNPFALPEKKMPRLNLCSCTINQAHEFFNYKPLLTTEDTEIDNLADSPFHLRKRSSTIPKAELTLLNSNAKNDTISYRKHSKNTQHFIVKMSQLEADLQSILYCSPVSLSEIPYNSVYITSRSHKNILSLDLDETLVSNITDSTSKTNMNFTKILFYHNDGCNITDKHSSIFYCRPYLSMFLDSVSKMYDVIVWKLLGVYFF